MAAGLVFVLLFLAFTGPSSATWCVCKDGLSDAVLQKALDYACGAGADCNPLRQNGVCYNPNTVRAHCSYAVNSYYQRKAQSGATCDFNGAASISSTDPSVTGCAFPASQSASGGSTTPSTTTPSTTTPSTTTPSSGTPTTVSPYITTPASSGSSIYGGMGSGLGPSGLNNDVSHGGLKLLKGSTFVSSFVTLFGLLAFMCS